MPAWCGDLTTISRQSGSNFVALLGIAALQTLAHYTMRIMSDFAWNRFAALALMLALSGIPFAVSAQDAPAPLPSVTLPADFDRVLRDYERAWRANDVPALVKLFALDGFVLQPGRAPVRGHEGLTRTYTGQGGGDLRLRAYAFQASDSVGFIIGGYRYGDAPADGGKFTLTLRRSSGGPWLIVSDMDNGNAARRPAPSPLRE